MARASTRWYNGIRAKTILLVIIFTATPLAGLSVYQAYQQERQLTRELERQADLTSRRLSRHLVGPLWDLDNSAADSILATEMLDRSLQAIVVWDADTRAVFSARERGPGGRLRASSGAIAGDLIKSSLAVKNGDKIIGEVAVFVSKASLLLHRQSSIKLGLINLAALVLVLALILSILIKSLVSQPVLRLTRQLRKMSEGDLKRIIVVESNDEIGQLADSIERLQNRLRNAFRRAYRKTPKT